MVDEQTEIGDSIETVAGATHDDDDAPPIDPQLLADRIYRLLCEELRLERARGV
jgi:hypothetical protein